MDPPPSAVSNRNWQEQKAPENLTRNRGCSRVTCSSQRHSVTTQAPDAKQKKKKIKRETGGTAGEQQPRQYLSPFLGRVFLPQCVPLRERNTSEEGNASKMAAVHISDTAEIYEL